MLVNLTPHPINLPNNFTLPKCANPPRLTERIDQYGIIDNVPVVRKSFDTSGCYMPKQIENIYYIVPLVIAQAFKGIRDDLLVTDDPVRDDQGRIIGCRRLAIV